MSSHRPTHVALLLSLLVVTGAACEPRPGHTDPHRAEGPSSHPAAFAQESGARGLAPADRDAAEPDGRILRGEPGLLDGAPRSVAELVRDARRLEGQAVLVQGTATQVCAKKGCWWILRGENASEQIRITSKGYRFFVPRQIAGKSARVHGTLEVKRLSRQEAAHLRDDAREAGEAPAEDAPLPKVELRLAADALEMT